MTASQAVKTSTKKAVTISKGFDIRRFKPTIETKRASQVASEKKKKRLNSEELAKAHR
jgi:hypothetical protein